MTPQQCGAGAARDGKHGQRGFPNGYSTPTNQEQPPPTSDEPPPRHDTRRVDTRTHPRTQKTHSPFSYTLSLVGATGGAANIGGSWWHLRRRVEGSARCLGDMTARDSVTFLLHAGCGASGACSTPSWCRSGEVLGGGGACNGATIAVVGVVSTTADVAAGLKPLAVVVC